jgi:diacylglycerol kinase (ATP)
MHIAPGAKPDDGRLDICVVGDISRLTALRELPNLYRGTHMRNPSVSMYTARRIEIDGATLTRVHLDGEPFGGLPLGVSIAPSSLSVAVSG